MGAESSKKVVRAQKEYFTPEERQSVLAIAQKLAGSSGNITLPAMEVREHFARTRTVLKPQRWQHISDKNKNHICGDFFWSIHPYLIFFTLLPQKKVFKGASMAEVPPTFNSWTPFQYNLLPINALSIFYPLLIHINGLPLMLLSSNLSLYVYSFHKVMPIYFYDMPKPYHRTMFHPFIYSICHFLLCYISYILSLLSPYRLDTPHTPIILLIFTVCIHDCCVHSVSTSLMYIF